MCLEFWWLFSFYENDSTDLNDYINGWFRNIDNDLRNVSSALYLDLERSFNGQVKNREDICGTISFKSLLKSKQVFISKTP